MKKRHRFTPEFKAQVVLEVLTGAQSPAEACRRHALSCSLSSSAYPPDILSHIHAL
jgi:transposase-like protein